MLKPAWPLALLLVFGGAAVSAAPLPYVPADDAVVIAPSVAAREPEALALRRLRQRLQQTPTDEPAAATYAREAIALGRRSGDPRYFGHAESALAPWAAAVPPPAEIAWLRAVIAQRRHDFDGARLELDALLQREPAYAPALLTRAGLHLTQGRPQQARRDCAALIGQGSLLTATTCAALAASVLGDAGSALASLDTLRPLLPTLGADERLWALTAAAEIAARLERVDEADARFRRALEQTGAGADDYLLLAYADFLLANRRPAEVIALLRERRERDGALLRLALAETALGEDRAAQSTAALQQRFDTAQARGESGHEREQAWAALALRRDAEAALRLALQNWQHQREPIDARLLLEAAAAAGNPAAADPVREWMRETGIEDPALRRLAGPTP